jgi:hypothetical protein
VFGGVDVGGVAGVVVLRVLFQRWLFVLSSLLLLLCLFLLCLLLLVVVVVVVVAVVVVVLVVVVVCAFLFCCRDLFGVLRVVAPASLWFVYAFAYGFLFCVDVVCLFVVRRACLCLFVC